MVVVNRTIVYKEEIEKINPKQINHVNVMKGEAGTVLYGDKGKNGVVEITLKDDVDGKPVRVADEGENVLTGKINKVEVSKQEGIKVDADEVI